MIKAKFEGEICFDADSIDCVRPYIENNGDLTEGEYIKITKIEKVEEKEQSTWCKSCKQITNWEVIDDGEPECMFCGGKE